MQTVPIRMQCKRAKLLNSLDELGKAFQMSSAEVEALANMFCVKKPYMPVFDTEFQCEFAFSFWGFVKSDNARWQLLRVLCSCLHPRMYIASETLEGHHVEGVMIVKLDVLRTTREHFEVWLELFVDRLRMSGGVVVFQKYMGKQMIASMHRVQQGQKLRTNISVNWNKDLLLLYNLKLKTHLEETRVRSFTSMDFTPDNFINMFVHDMLRRDGVLGGDEHLRRVPDETLEAQRPSESERSARRRDWRMLPDAQEVRYILTRTRRNASD